MNISQNLQGLITLALVLTPLFIGFAIPLNHKFIRLADALLSYIVYAILLLIGIELAHVQGFGSQILGIITFVGVLALLTIGTGLIGLMIFDRFMPWAPPNKDKVAVHKVNLTDNFFKLSALASAMQLVRYCQRH